MGFSFFSALQTKTDVTVNEEVSYTRDSRILQKKTCSRFLWLWPEDAELLLNLQKKRSFSLNMQTVAGVSAGSR